MNDFFELEKKCKKLQKKKLIKLLVIFFIPILLLIIIYFAYKYITKPKPKIEHKIIKPQHKTIKKPKAKIEHKTIKPKPIKKEKPKPIQTPILDIDIDLNNIKNPDIQSTKKPKKIENKSIKPKPIKKENSKPKKILQNETISFEKALSLAQIYYNNGDYQNSMKWCKIASRIDNSNEKVWKLYALNLDKIGKTSKAIQIIKTYLQYRDSRDLRYLLQRLEK